MAKRKKSSDDADVAAKVEAVADAAEEIQDEATDETSEGVASGDATADDAVTDEPAEATAEGDEEPGDAVDQEGENTDEDAGGSDDEAGEVAEDAPDSEAVTPEPASEAPVAPKVISETIVERRGGFFPMLLGGVAAAALGYGVAAYTGASGLFQPGQDPEAQAFEQETRQALAAHSDAIGNLSAGLEKAAKGPDLSGIEAAQSDLKNALEGLSTRIDEAQAQLSAMEDRLAEIEKRPISEGASGAAVAAYERELRALQETIAAQRAEFETMAADARTMEANAEETAQATMRRAALTRIQTALENGTPFASALSDLESAGVSAPAVLAQVASKGVPSRAALEESFPEAARAALAVSRAREAAEKPSGGIGIGTFLKTQLGVRSLTPQAGNDPDAVLSRAEAALRDGRLGDALAEIEALPEEGRAELSDWAGDVTRRLDAIAAAQSLVENLN